MSHRINLNKLKNPNSHSFLNELQYAEDNLTKHDAKTFFKTVLSHFDYEIPKKTGNSILQTINSLLRDDKLIEVFIDHNFTLSLPFDLKEYTDSTLEVFLQLIQYDSGVFTSDVVDAFSTLIQRAPDKCLVIFGIYSQNCSDLDDRMNVFDLIIENAELYVNDEVLVYNYLSLLGFLCDNYTDFRKKRLPRCTKILMAVMDTDDVNELKQIYKSIKTFTSLSPPFNHISKHVKSKSLQSTVLSYLVFHPPLEANSKFIQLMLDIATEDKRGSFVLYQMAGDEEIASKLLENEDWIRMSLPTFEDTLKLLLVVFQHTNLREEVAQNRYFFKFLATVLKSKKVEPAILTVICTVLRRIDLENYVEELENQRLLTAFFDKALETNDDLAIHSALLLTDTYARCDYFSEFLDFIEVICDIAQENGPLSNVAAQLLVDLASYKKCLSAMCKLGMKSFFKKKLNDKKLRSTAEKFFDYLD